MGRYLSFISRFVFRNEAVLFSLRCLIRKQYNMSFGSSSAMKKDSFISEDKLGNERKIPAHEIHLSCESISIKKEDRSYDRAAEPHLPENET